MAPKKSVLSKVSIELPDDYVLPETVLRDLKASHPEPPSPVHKVLLKDLCVGLYSGEPGPLEFKIPAFVHGYPLYDAAAVARWMFDRLKGAGYDVSVNVRGIADPKERDMWPERGGPDSDCPKERSEFPYDAEEYDAALEADEYTVVVR